MTNIKEYEELKPRVEELQELLDERFDKFDSEWFKTNSNENFSFSEWEDAREEIGGEELKEYRKLARRIRIVQPYELDEIPDYGDVMTLERFIKCVESGGFIDYDGFGRYAKDGKESDVEIYPSDVHYNSIREDFDSVVWYNR